MKPRIEDAITLHKQGKSMKEIGEELGRSAAWVSKGFKKIGYGPVREKYNKFAYTEEEAEFVRQHWFTHKAKWIAKRIGKTPQSVRQWARKHVGKKGLSVEEKKLDDIECLNCGIQFKPTQSTTKFCSYKCMGKYKQKYKEMACLNCGTVFRPYTATMQYCSHECSQEAYKKVHISVRPYEYGGVNMRSTWEQRFAQWLDDQGLEWEYEPTFFKILGNKRYAPDFYIPELDIYYEVKGWMDERSITKINAFREEYPDKTLIIIDKEMMEQLRLRTTP